MLLMDAESYMGYAGFEQMAIRRFFAHEIIYGWRGLFTSIYAGFGAQAAYRHKPFSFIWPESRIISDAISPDGHIAARATRSIMNYINRRVIVL